MEPLQHDGLTKSQVKNALYEYIYAPVRKQFQNRLDTIILQNALISGYGHKSFHYKGELYTCDTTPPPRKWNKLSPKLREQMDTYLRDMEFLNQKELPYVLGYINRILNSTNHFGDYLKLFPSCLYPPLKKLIDSCPCHTKVLSDEDVMQLTAQNQESINMIRERMMTNLLL